MFIRDAEETCYVAIEDPTGWGAVAAGRAGARSSSEPLFDIASSSTSSPSSSPGDERERMPTTKARPGQGAKRTMSDTFTQTRAHKNSKAGRSAAPPRTEVVFTNGPLSEEPGTEGDHEDRVDTPKQTTFPSFPYGQTNSTAYITKPPSPVQPPYISYHHNPPPSLSNEAVTRKNLDVRINTFSSTDRNKSQRPHPPTRAESTNSTGSTSSSSSSFYKPSDPYSRFGSLSPFSRLGRFKRKDSTTTNGIGDDGDTITNDNSATAAGYSRRGSGAGSSGGASGGSGSSSGSKLTEAEKKRTELQTRVLRARTQMPGGVPLRVFRDPRECEEDVGGILG